MPENIRKVTLAHRFKTWILRRKYGANLELSGPVRILGKLPVFKLPRAARLKLGSKVVLNSDFFRTNTALTYRCTLVCGYEGRIEIGDGTMLNGACVVAYREVRIGRNCQIASGTLITDTDFHPVDAETRLRESLGQPIDFSSVNKKPVVIGDNVWIGWGSTILKGVTIGDNSIVGAGSVVVSDVPANVLVAGNPATVKKTFAEISPA